MASTQPKRFQDGGKRLQPFWTLIRFRGHFIWNDDIQKLFCTTYLDVALATL